MVFLGSHIVCSFCSSVLTRYRGALNGVAMSVTSIFRTVGPSFGGSIFAWSLSHDYAFPFNYALAFFCFAAIFAWSYHVSLSLPLSLNEPIKEA